MGNINLHVIVEQVLNELRLSPGTDCPVVAGGGEANVGANVGVGEGESYRDKTGVVLNFRTIKAGSGMTVETIGDEIVVTSTAGGIVGPDPSTLRAIATWADITGTALYDNFIRIDDAANPGVGPNYRAIQALSAEDPATWRNYVRQENVIPNGEPGGFTHIYGDIDLQTRIEAVADPRVKTPTGIGRILHEAISTEWVLPQRGDIESGDPDTQYVLSLEAKGANGARVYFHVGSRIPETQVTAYPGSFYYRTNGVDSALYQHRGSAFGNTGWVELAGLGDIFAKDVLINKVGTPPATVTDVQDTINHFGMAGALQNGSYITDSGSAQIDIAAGVGYIRTTDSPDGELVSLNWAALENQSIPTDATRYVGIEYNAGSPQAVIRTSENWNDNTDFRLGTVVNQGGTLHILNNPQFASSFGSRIYHRLFETLPLQRANRLGGLIPSSAGTRNLIVSAGELYDGFNEFVISAIDTSGSDTFDLYYRNGSGGWTEVAAQSQWDNLQYDDGDGTLGTLGTNNYGLHWLYLEADGNLVVLYGQGDYNTQVLAEGAAPPTTVPPRITAHGRLIGRLLFLKSASTAISVNNIWQSVFLGTGGGGGTGDVIGPPSAFNGAFALFDGTTGKLIKNSPMGVNDLTDQHVIVGQDTDTPATWIDLIQVQKIGANGVAAGMYVVVGDTDNPLYVKSSADPWLETGAGLGKIIHEKIATEWVIPYRGSVRNQGADTLSVLQLYTDGTNGANAGIHVGNRTPQGNVNAAPGTLYVRVGGTSSRLYQHQGSSASTTGWVEIQPTPNVGFYAYRSSGTQTLTTGVEAVIAFPNKRDDTGGDFDATTNYRFTAPTAGRYTFLVSANVTLASAGCAELRIYSSVHGLVAESSGCLHTGGTAKPSVGVTLLMDASEYVEVKGYQGTGSNATIQNSALNFSGAQISKV